MGEAARRWRGQLEAWAIPDHILASAPQSPWTLPIDVFTRRADAAAPGTPSWQRAVEALERRGCVLDVGAGAGAASLPLAPQTTQLTAVDSSAAILDELRPRAAAIGLNVRTIIGRWPDVAPQVPVADVAVCHHVLYNVPDLDEFAVALTTHARRRIVAELTPRHPLWALNPLWKVMHGLDRPDGPTAEDAMAVLHEAGIPVTQERWRRPPRPEYDSFDAQIQATRGRLCLPAHRDAELARALVDLGVDPAHPRDLGTPGEELVTVWWDGQGSH